MNSRGSFRANRSASTRQFKFAKASMSISDLSSTIAVLSDLPRELLQTLVHRITETESDSWHISNKYYSADVVFRYFNLNAASNLGEVPALVLAVDRLSMPSKELFKDFASEDYDIAIVIGVKHETEQIGKDFSDDWQDLCLDHGFEWIDMEATSSEEEGVNGLDRLKEALQAYPWSTPTFKAPNLEEDEEFSDFASADTDILDSIKASDIESAKSLFTLSKSSGEPGSDDDQDDIETIFAQLQTMKLKADGMDMEERRKFAAKVALGLAAHLDDQV